MKRSSKIWQKLAQYKLKSPDGDAVPRCDGRTRECEGEYKVEDRIQVPVQ